jgi:hypothetical protein
VSYAAITPPHRASRCLAMTQGTRLARFDLLALPTQRSPEQTSPRGFFESRRGIVSPAEQLKLVEAIRAWFDQGFQKTPA